MVYFHFWTAFFDKENCVYVKTEPKSVNKYCPSTQYFAFRANVLRVLFSVSSQNHLL